MRATMMFGPGDVRLVTLPDPVIQEPTDAIVRIVRACICGSDLHPYHSMPDTPEGHQMGHEFLGIVEEMGRDVTGLRVGDFVVGTFAFQDNTCEYCREGVHTSCIHGGFFSAAQAEFLRVPQASGTLVVLPEGADESMFASLLTLSDVYLTGWHAAYQGRVQPGKTVAVVGDGAVGLSAVLASKQLGAERIILLGHHADRVALGREFGATDVVSERGEDAVNAIMELTGGEPPHVVLEAVGHMAAYEQAYALVRPGGTISRVGVPQYEQAPIGFGSLFGKNATLTGGPAPVRAYIDSALPQVLAGEIQPGKVFDVTLPLADVASGYAAMDARTALKVMLVP